MVGSTLLRRDALPAALLRRDALPAALLVYGAVLAVFLPLPGLPPFTASVGRPEGFTFQEALDLLTPLVIIPVAWLVFDLAGGLGRVGNLMFLVAAACWVEAQGIHLAANAIGDAFASDAARNAYYATTPGELDHWLDETLSHWLWHVGWIAISTLIIAAATRHRGDRSDPVTPAAWMGGALQGATFFVVTVEGATTQLGIPFSIAVLAWSMIARWRGLARQPVVGFFLATAVVTLAGYLAWAALNGWSLPEFSAVGLV